MPVNHDLQVFWQKEKHMAEMRYKHRFVRVKDLFRKVQTVGWGFMTNTTEYLHYNTTCISM